MSVLLVSSVTKLAMAIQCRETRAQIHGPPPPLNRLSIRKQALNINCTCRGPALNIGFVISPTLDPIQELNSHTKPYRTESNQLTGITAANIEH